MSLDISLMTNCDVGTDEPYEVELWEANITHNLAPMWRQAGCYDALYMSYGMKASECLPFLRRGLEHMQKNPEEYKALNPDNGWGDYEGAVDFLKDAVNAFEQYPGAWVWIWK